MDEYGINDEYAIAAHRLGMLIDPEAMAQMMQRVPCDDEPMSKEQKAYWLRVAEWLRPDWAQGLYHAAVFAKKVARP